MDYKAIIYEKKDNYAIITMNQPESMNAIKQDMMDELKDVFHRVNDEEEVKVVILTGTGRAFCAGGDIARMREGFSRQSAIDYLDMSHSLVKAWQNVQKITIAAVNGAATGAGLSMTLLADISIVSEAAKMGCAFINMGLVPDYALAYYLPRIIGPQRAKELIFTGRIFLPDEAYAMDMINKVVKPEELMNEAEALAKRLAGGATYAQRLAKRMLQIGMDSSFDTLLNVEGILQGTAFVSDDSREAVNAFMEKRKPVFHGR